MQAKPVQIAIIVIGLLVGIVGIFLAVSGGSSPSLADKLILVDVTTGDTYAVSIKGRSIVLPFKHPETDERTLLPVEQEEDGPWKISSRYISALDRIESIHDSVNQDSGVVDIPDDQKPTVIK